MKRRRLLFTAVTAVLATGGAVAVALPASAAGPTATFVRTADRGAGWEGRYTVSNGGTSTLSSWSVAFLNSLG